jgi:hypothetical protein
MGPFQADVTASVVLEKSELKPKPSLGGPSGALFGELANSMWTARLPSHFTAVVL